MDITVDIAKLQECAEILRRGNKAIEEAIPELRRIAAEIGNDSDDILTKRGYEDRLKKAADYMQARHDAIEKVADACTKVSEAVVNHEKKLLGTFNKN